MDATAVSQADYLDILFENRNKKYGSYELRKHYDHRMRKAILIVTGACLSLAVYSILTSGKVDKIDNSIRFIPTTISEVNIETPKVKVEPPKPTLPPASKPTLQNTPPEIVDDTKVTDPPKTIDDFAGKEPGNTDAAGDPDGISGSTSGTGNTTVVTPTMNAPVTWAEQMPEFNGNLNDYLQTQLRYPQQARDAGIEGKVTIQFVVNEDGTVSNAKILKGIGAGCDEEAIRVINSMPKWKPGKQNGKSIKVYYTLPIRFLLQ